MEVPEKKRKKSTSKEISALELQKLYQEKAYNEISKGLDIDAKSPLDALTYYEKGVSYLRKALDLSFSQQEWEQASVLCKKMKKNLLQVEERIQTINQKYINNKPVVIDLVGEDRMIEDETKPTQTIPPPSRSFLSSFSRIFSSKNETKQNTTIIPSKPIQSIPVQSTPSNTNGIHPMQTTTISNRSSRLNTKRLSNSGHLKNPTQTTTLSQPQNRSGDMSLLQGVDTQMANLILNDVVVADLNVSFDQVVGMDEAKQALQESVILPMLRPDIFTGLRSPVKGILLFGPPGNGKTFIAKAIASEANARFFSISASSLTSKWVGESEKLVKALFACARYLQPAIIFIDEIDSLLSERSSNENEASRRLKTEFLVQFDGIGSNSEDRILVMGATNRPQDLDEAARRRFVKRIYIPLPSFESRKKLIKSMVKKMNGAQLHSKEIDQIANLTEGYSFADLTSLATDAAMEPIREVGMKIKDLPVEALRPVNFQDFKQSLQRVRPSVSNQSLKQFQDWNKEYGSIAY